LEMYRWMWQRINDWSEAFPRYLCMEPPWVWEQVANQPAPGSGTLEGQLIARLQALR
jgi:hypothetical protein